MADLSGMSDEELAGHGHAMPQLVQAEFERRQLKIAQKNSEDQKRGLDATVETAVATKANAKYMLWSVIVLALASVADLIVNFLRG